jgi:hypothetical protein
MMQVNEVVQHLQDTVTAYMQGKRSFCEAQSAIEAQLPKLIDAIARAIRDDWGDGPTQAWIDARQRRTRSVYAQLMIGANRLTRDGAGSLETEEIEKLLRLICWMRDTVEDLEKPRSLPAVSAAA